jgi:hypothetical protein
MHSLDKILKNKTAYKRKIRAMPREKARKFGNLIKILVLSDMQIIDALIATYFESQIGLSPIPTPHRIPKEILPNFENDKEFFFYVSDLLKIRITY